MARMMKDGPIYSKPKERNISKKKTKEPSKVKRAEPKSRPSDEQNLMKPKRATSKGKVEKDGAKEPKKRAASKAE